MNDFDFAIVTNVETKSRYDLKWEFYRRNKFRRHDWGGTSKLVANKPLAFVRESTTSSDSIRVQYGSGYYVMIEQGRNTMSGPHSGKLYVKTEGEDDAIWLGTIQFDGAFYDDKGLRKQLKQAILSKQYYCSDESEEEVFEFGQPVELVDMTPDIDPLPLRTTFKKFRILKLSADHHVPKCPKCKLRKRTLKGLRGHYLNAHGKRLIFSYPKPIDKAAPW